MKYFIASVLLAALVIFGTAGSFNRGISDERFKDLSKKNTIAKPVASSVPRVALCWDDGTARQFTLYQIRQFTSRGLPISLAINDANIGESGYATWAQVRAEMSYAADNGVDFEICDHSSDHWYSNPEDFTYDELIETLDGNVLMDSLGFRPTFFRAPGLATAQAFYNSNRNSIVALLDSLGFEYSDMGYGSSTKNGVMSWMPNSIYFDTETNPQPGRFAVGFPGVTNNGLYLPAATTIDMNLLFERDGTCGTSVDSWTIDSKGGTTVTDWAYTFAYLYQYHLANRWGGIWAMHDSVNVDAAADPSGSTITAGANAVGAFSPTYVAEVCSLLQAKGYVQFVTASEYGDWCTSRLEAGADLLGNRTITEIPQFEIGDTSGVHVPWLNGGGSQGGASSSWPTSTTAWGFKSAIDADVDYHLDPDDATWPLDHIGDHHRGYRGRMGAYKVNTDNSRLTVSRTMLPPGRYSLSWAQEDHRIVWEEFHIAIAGQYYKISSSAVQQYPAYGDTLISLRWRDAQKVSSGTLFTGGEWWVQHIDFVIPRDPPGENFAAAVFGSETGIAATADTWWLDQWWGAFTLYITNTGSPVMADFHLFYYPLD